MVTKINLVTGPVSLYQKYVLGGSLTEGEMTQYLLSESLPDLLLVVDLFSWEISRLSYFKSKGSKADIDMDIRFLKVMREIKKIFNKTVKGKEDYWAVLLDSGSVDVLMKKW